MTAPNRVLVAGDWHGNLRWARGVVELLPELLPDEPVRRIVHVGDFGIWPGRSGKDFLLNLTAALDSVAGEVWFVDGNHEDHDHLGRLLDRAGGVDAPIRVTDRIHWLPRGHRWTWHDRTWLALGGGTSVDRPARREGRDWWPAEAISELDYRRAVEPGPADVMVTHDCPAGVPLNLPKPPAWWDLEDAHRHRLLLGAIVTKVQPRWLMHGHYHLAHETTVATSYGELQVTGLDMDGALRGAQRVLDVRTMDWAPAEEAVSA